MTDVTPEMVQPASELLQEQAPEMPKRRGRPPGSKNKTTGTTRRGRPKKSLADKIGGTLTMLNLAFVFAPKEFQGDALDEYEISALAKALDEAAKENATLYKWLDAALGGTGSAMLNLAVIGACIAGRRMARHEMFISADWDARLGAFVAMNTGDMTANPIDFGSMFAEASVNGRGDA